MTKREIVFYFLFLLLVLFFILYGVNSDLSCSRMSTETEQVNFALKFGTGDFNPHRFAHPPFFSYVLFFFYGLSFVIGKVIGVFRNVLDFQIFYYKNPWFFCLVSRLLVAFISILSLIMTYLIAKRMFSKRVGFFACALLASFPSFIRLAHYGTGDMPLLFISLLAFYFIVSTLTRGKTIDYLLSGLFIGLAVGTKYNGGILVLPFVLAVFLSKDSKNMKARKLLTGLGFMIIGFFISCPFAFFDYKTFFSHLFELFSRMKSESYNFASWKADKPGWIYVWSDTFPFGIGFFTTILFAISIFKGLYSKNKKLYLILLTLVFFLAYTGRWSLIKPRYYLFLFPFIAMLIADFLLYPGRFRRSILVLVSILIFGTNVLDILRFESSVSVTPVNIMAKEWTEDNISEDSSITISDGIPLTPNKASIDLQLDEIAAKGYGEGIYLKTLRGNLDLFPRKYFLKKLPLPWMEDYDPEDFDFHALRRSGIKYFIITHEFTEYLLDPGKYGVQADFFKDLSKSCKLIKQFRNRRPLIEPEYTGEYEYALIYRCE